MLLRLYWWASESANSLQVFLQKPVPTVFQAFIFSATAGPCSDCFWDPKIRSESDLLSTMALFRSPFPFSKRPGLCFKFLSFVLTSEDLYSMTLRPIYVIIVKSLNFRLLWTHTCHLMCYREKKEKREENFSFRLTYMYMFISPLSLSLCLFSKCYSPAFLFMPVSHTHTQAPEKAACYTDLHAL